MNDTSDILLGFQKTIEAIKSTSAAQFLMTIGFLLIIITFVSLVASLKLRPEQIPRWFRVLSLVSLIFGVLFCAAGPSVAFLNLTKYSIPQISSNIAYKNLRDNSEVTWLIRLIPYNPTDNKELSIGKIEKLGPAVKFTFVGPYQELKGYKVAEAVKKLGGSLGQGMHVSAIIFRLDKNKVKIFPANARGLVQVVQLLEADDKNKIKNKLITEGVLTDAENDNLQQDDRLSWSWDEYFGYYQKYCKLSHTFRCGKYDARGLISSIRSDWHPMGISTSDTSNICRHDESYCDVKAVKDWDTLKDKTLSTFGSRVFLIPNLDIRDLSDRYLIEFGEPTVQVIPEIGLADD